MKKIVISFLLILVSLSIFYCSLYLGDLAYIGGYDGFAPKELAMEFWYGKYSDWVPAAEIGFMATIAIGIIGTILSIIALLYFLLKEIIRLAKRFYNCAFSERGK